MYDYSQIEYGARERTRQLRRAADAERLQGIQVSSPPPPTARRWRALSSDSRTGATSDQCLPTGHRWNLTQPSRSPLNDTLGIQSIRNR